VKYIDEFRDGDTARRLAAKISTDVQPGRRYHLMEFCGGHTHAIFRYGVQDLLPEEVKMIHGPGCPVCVLPIGRLDMALELAARPEVILCSYGDMLRVPGSGGRSLIKSRSAGADVRMVYSAADALDLARQHPDREVVFFAIGFETTTPPTAVAIRAAATEGLGNFSVLCNHVLTPAAVANLLDSPAARELGEVPIDGFLGPAHVSIVIGTHAYERFAEGYRKPVVISGFEPLDVMQSIHMLIRQLNDGRAEVENQYTRAVTRLGNVKAQELMAEVFETRSEFEWRGLGIVPDSALQIRRKFELHDAERRFRLDYVPVDDNRACECGSILRGVLDPTDCKLFGRACTPETPMGSCMVSSEGACAAYYQYGRFRGAARATGAAHA
jgi:hydrogenase expression/formation protein HypD